MATIKVIKSSSVKSIKAQFTKEFACSIRFYNGKKIADEIEFEERVLTIKKKLKTELKPILKSDERVNLALKIDREFLKALRGEMMRRKGFRS